MAAINQCVWLKKKKNQFLLSCKEPTHTDSEKRRISTSFFGLSPPFWVDGTKWLIISPRIGGYCGVFSSCPCMLQAPLLSAYLAFVPWSVLSRTPTSIDAAGEGSVGPVVTSVTYIYLCTLRDQRTYLSRPGLQDNCITLP